VSATGIASVSAADRPLGVVVRLFLAFASAYFLSALVRAVTATLAPVFSAELGLSAADLGLLAGAYFASFAATQLPMGSALDRWGPQRVLLVLLCAAVLGCWAFSRADTLAELLAARLLIGAGMSACLMAALTCFSHLLPAAVQLRANAWMLMTGSMGMLASTLPVQWLLPVLGWRGLFEVVSGLLLLAMALIWRWVPAGVQAHAAPASEAGAGVGGYRAVFTHPAFIRMAPLALCVYGGLLAMQSLWIGPWLTRVVGQSPGQAAAGLFLVNLGMLFAFLCWGLVTPWLGRRGYGGERLIRWLLPLSVAGLAVLAWRGAATSAWGWMLWCVCTSVVTLSQPALAQAFPGTLAGRALSAFNLLIFAGVFLLQWGIGALVDRLQAHGWSAADAFRVSVALLAVLCALSYAWMVGRGRAPIIRTTQAEPR
jgi:predicted MFS family arabinose efflux permease